METKFVFDKFMGEGDSSSILKNGFMLTAKLVWDHDADIDDRDCYDQKTIDSWKRDEWHFFGLVMSASFNGVDIPINVSLWGIEGNMPGLEAECSKHMADEAMAMASEALEEAKESRKQLILKLMS